MKRNLEVDLAQFGFEEVVIPRVVWRTPSWMRGNFVQEVENPWDAPETRPTRRFEIVRGHFQSEEIVSHVADDFLGRLDALVPSFAGQDFVAVHVRLGDYLNPSTTAFHGLTSPEWSLRMAREVSASNRVPSINVLTDFPSFLRHAVDDQLLRGATIDSSNTAIEALGKMSFARHMVMSNSSMSWWAARLGSWRRSNISVYFPVPWFSESTPIEQELCLPSWTIVERDFTTR